MNIEQTRNLIRQGKDFDWETMDMDRKRAGYCVYCLYDVAENLAYIGMTKSFKLRFLAHRSLFRRNIHYCWELQKAFNEEREIKCFIIQCFPSEFGAAGTEYQWIKAFGDKALNIFPTHGREEKYNLRFAPIIKTRKKWGEAKKIREAELSARTFSETFAPIPGKAEIED